MRLRTSDIKAPFLAALDAIGHPAELKEIADWINTNMPLPRGPVKNDGTLGRTRDALEAECAIERDMGRYRRAARNKLQSRPPARIVLERDTLVNGIVYPAGEYARR
jgi:hypothetical protein